MGCGRGLARLARQREAARGRGPPAARRSPDFMQAPGSGASCHTAPPSESAAGPARRCSTSHSTSAPSSPLLNRRLVVPPLLSSSSTMARHVRQLSLWPGRRCMEQSRAHAARAASAGEQAAAGGQPALERGGCQARRRRTGPTHLRRFLTWKRWFVLASYSSMSPSSLAAATTLPSPLAASATTPAGCHSMNRLLCSATTPADASSIVRARLEPRCAGIGAGGVARAASGAMARLARSFASRRSAEWIWSRR